MKTKKYLHKYHCKNPGQNKKTNGQALCKQTVSHKAVNSIKEACIIYKSTEIGRHIYVTDMLHIG